MPAKRPYKMPVYKQNPNGPGSRHEWKAAFRDRIGEAKERLSSAKTTPRQVLGVSADADWKTIHKTFHKLSLTCHPDRFPGDADAARRWNAVNDAHMILEDAHLANHLSLIG